MSLEIELLKQAKDRDLAWTCYWPDYPLRGIYQISRADYRKILRALAKDGYLEKTVKKYRHRTCLQKNATFQKTGTYYTLTLKGRELLDGLKEMGL